MSVLGRGRKRESSEARQKGSREVAPAGLERQVGSHGASLGVKESPNRVGMSMLSPRKGQRCSGNVTVPPVPLSAKEMRACSIRARPLA